MHPHLHHHHFTNSKLPSSTCTTAMCPGNDENSPAPNQYQDLLEPISHLHRLKSQLKKWRRQRALRKSEEESQTLRMRQQMEWYEAQTSTEGKADVISLSSYSSSIVSSSWAPDYNGLKAACINKKLSRKLRKLRHKKPRS